MINKFDLIIPLDSQEQEIMKLKQIIQRDSMEKELLNQQMAMAAEYLIKVNEKSQKLGSEWEQLKLGQIKDLTEFQSSIAKQKAEFEAMLGSMEHLIME